MAPGGGSIRFRIAGSAGLGDRRARLSWLPAVVGHTAVVLWLFGSAFWSGRLLYFRDLSTQYAPWYAFAADSLRHGVWPLWNPTVHAGEPFLLAYPPDLLLLLIGGWRACLGIGPALHLWLGLMGGTHLARRLGMPPGPAWLAGTVYGLGGFTLSLANLVQLFEAAAWAPWVIAAFVGLVRRPTRRQVAVAAVLLAVQASTLAAEIVLLTLAAACVLCADSDWLRPRRWLPLVATGALTLLLAAPAVVGGMWLTRGTARSGGFTVEQALAFSLHPGTLVEVLLPRWLGDPHGFSDADYWGREFFPEGYPYLVSLYLGAAVLLAATQAGRRRRAWLLVAIGLVLCLGSYGPLALLPHGFRTPLRGPQKLFFLCQLGVALLAGFGLERRERVRPSRAGRAALVLAGAGVLMLAVAVRVTPDHVREVASQLWPQLRGPRGAWAARATWPSAWMPTGALGFAAALALARGGRVARLAALAAAFDLATANSRLNALAPSSFYDLRPDVENLIRPVRGHDGRVFSYGVAQTPGLRFEPAMQAAASDVWLYYLDRQSLLPATYVLDHLEGAGEFDQTGFSPPGASLDPAEAVPERFREHHGRLERAGVKWVLSFRDLPSGLAVPRAAVKLPEITLPLRLFELPAALPRAFFVGRWEVVADADARLRRLEQPGFDPSRVVLVETVPDAPAGFILAGVEGARVAWQRIDAHTIHLDVRSPPGLVVIVEGWHPDWRIEGSGAPTALLRANDRYCALVTPGGHRRYTLRFRPRWPAPALAFCALGLVVAGGLFVAGSVSLFTGPGPGSVLDSAGREECRGAAAGGRDGLDRAQAER